MVSEYDPHGPVIRINQRALARYRTAGTALTACQTESFIDLAVAHELYHHQEAIGEVERLPTHVAREQAADAFARANVIVDGRLAAFMKARS